MFRNISRVHIKLALSFKPLPHPTIRHSNSTFESPPLRSLLSTLSFPFSSSQILLRRRQDENFNDNEEFSGDPKRPPKLFVVQPRFRPESILQAKLEEALNLANSLEEQRDGYYETEFSEKELPPHIVVQNPIARSPRADTYFRTGTVDTIKCPLDALEFQDGVDAIFVNASLTGIQQRNLEMAAYFGKTCLDRVGLIIEIFNAHAQTKEAKLQAELAALMYKRSRLVRVRGPGGRYTFGAAGEAEVVSARGRGSGGRGFISGAGETELQLQRRREEGAVLLSDTVGFISDLPVQLVEAFHATLEEVVEADLLVHVLDSSSPNLDEQRDSVLQVLRQIGVSEQKLQCMIEVWNKIDLQDKEFGFDAYDEDEEIGSLSVAEDDENASDQLSGLDVCEGDDNEDAKSELSWNLDEDEEGDYSDGWLLSGEEQESWLDYEVSSVGQATPINLQKWTPKKWRSTAKDPQSQSESGSHVKTSALTGVGLQELLELIDERLETKNEKVLERNIFDRKWRPPRSEDTIAVEQ